MPRRRKVFSKEFQRVVIGVLFLCTGLSLAGFILAFTLAGEIYEYQDTLPPEEAASQGVLPPVDAIVCLGGGRGRIAAAGELWSRYWEQSLQPGRHHSAVPVLYFSGMGHQATWAGLSRLLKQPIVQRIHPDQVIIEKESSNTDSNARWLLLYAKKLHWQKIVLVTSRYHMKRAHFIFDQVLKISPEPLYMDTYSVYQEPFSAQNWRQDVNGVRVTLVEYLKWVYYKWVWASF